MPELPEVESAVARLRQATVGKTIVAARVLHPALQRRLSQRKAGTLRGARVVSVTRRGKHQLLALDDGRTVHAHFRMTGDWTIDHVDDPLPRFARASLSFDDGTRVVLDDRLHAELVAWVERRYRDRMRAEDLADPALLTEVREAFDELTRILLLGSVYDFQPTPP